MNATFVSSFAGTGRRYVAAQAKVSGSQLHIQVAGPSDNRPYGLSADVEVSAQIRAFIDAQTKTANSLTGSYAKYAAVNLSVQEYGNLIHIQATGVNGNRPYGLSADMNDEDVANYLRGLLFPKVAPVAVSAFEDEDEGDEDDEPSVDGDAVLGYIEQVEGLCAKIRNELKG